MSPATLEPDVAGLIAAHALLTEDVHGSGTIITSDNWEDFITGVGGGTIDPDDLLPYALLDGTRPFTGSVTMPGRLVVGVEDYSAPVSLVDAGLVQSYSGALDQSSYRAGLNTDAQWRWEVRPDGTLLWGDGTTTVLPTALAPRSGGGLDLTGGSLFVPQGFQAQTDADHAGYLAPSVLGVWDATNQADLHPDRLAFSEVSGVDAATLTLRTGGGLDLTGGPLHTAGQILADDHIRGSYLVWANSGTDEEIVLGFDNHAGHVAAAINFGSTHGIGDPTTDLALRSGGGLELKGGPLRVDEVFFDGTRSIKGRPDWFGIQVPVGDLYVGDIDAADPSYTDILDGAIALNKPAAAVNTTATLQGYKGGALKWMVSADGGFHWGGSPASGPTPTSLRPASIVGEMEINGSRIVTAGNIGTYTPAPSDASATVKGVTRLSVAPVLSTLPIAVGDNDPRNSDARTPTAGSVVNSSVSALAAISYSKLALTGAILDADLAGSIAPAKIAGTAVVAADLAPYVRDGMANTVTARALVTPSSTGLSDQNGVVVKAPDSAWGNPATDAYGTGQAFMLLKAGTGTVDPDDSVLWRVDRRGGMGAVGGLHLGTGLRAYAGDTFQYSMHIDPVVDVPGIYVDAANNAPVSPWQQWRLDDGTVVAEIDSTATLKANRGAKVTALNASARALIVQMAAAASANPLDITTSAGASVFSVAPSGFATFGGALLGSVGDAAGTGAFLSFNPSGTLSGTVMVNPRTASNRGLTIKMAASPLAVPFEVQDSTGAMLSKITPTGTLFTSGGGVQAPFLQDAAATGPYFAMGATGGSIVATSRGSLSSSVFAFKGQASQTGNLTEWQDSTGAVLANVSSAGGGRFATLWSNFLVDSTNAGSYLTLGTTNVQVNARGSLSVATLISKGQASQTGDLLQTQTSGSVVTFAAPVAGGIDLSGVAGKGIKLKSPDGLTTKTLTIDNFGDLVLT
jgi:hypothetical protein